MKIHDDLKAVRCSPAERLLQVVDLPLYVRLGLVFRDVKRPIADRYANMIQATGQMNISEKTTGR